MVFVASADATSSVDCEAIYIPFLVPRDSKESAFCLREKIVRDLKSLFTQKIDLCPIACYNFIIKPRNGFLIYVIPIG